LWCPCVAAGGLVRHCHLTVVACPLELLLATKCLDHLVKGVLQAQQQQLLVSTVTNRQVLRRVANRASLAAGLLFAS
jgi:hypothetical protein